MLSAVIDTALQQGFLYVFAVFGIVISFRMMNFPDLTVDGSFAMGGAIVGALLANGLSPVTSLLFASLGGAVAGIATASLNRFLGISKILSGILIMLMAYSINLRIMGRSNISLLQLNTLFTPFSNANSLTLSLYLFIVVAIVLFLLCYFSITRLGLFIRATGDNEFMVRAQGVNVDWVYIIGIGFSNLLIAFSGGMVAQNQGFSDVNMGAGMIITALAALIIGESFVSMFRSLARLLGRKPGANARSSHLPWDVFEEFSAALLGSFLYFLIIAICLQLGLAPTDLNLATGVLVIIGIALRFQRTTSETYQKGKL